MRKKTYQYQDEPIEVDGLFEVRPFFSFDEEGNLQMNKKLIVMFKDPILNVSESLKIYATMVSMGHKIHNMEEFVHSMLDVLDSTITFIKAGMEVALLSSNITKVSGDESSSEGARSGEEGGEEESFSPYKTSDMGDNNGMYR